MWVADGRGNVQNGLSGNQKIINDENNLEYTYFLHENGALKISIILMDKNPEIRFKQFLKNIKFWFFPGPAGILCSLHDSYNFILLFGHLCCVCAFEM